MNKSTMMIDGSKLEKQLSKKSIKKTNASVEMGFCHSYLTWAIKSGSIARSATILLKKLYGIDFDSYKLITEEDTEASEANQKSFELDYASLNEVLYDAVFRAVRDALQA